MQHTLTPFLIRALSKTEEEKRREKRLRQTERKKEGGRLRSREREEYEGKGGEQSLLHWFLGSLAPALICLEKPQMCQSQLGTQEEREHLHTPNAVTYMYTEHMCRQHLHTHSAVCSQIEVRYSVQSKCLWVCVDYKNTCTKGAGNSQGWCKGVLMPFWGKPGISLWRQRQK